MTVFFFDENNPELIPKPIGNYFLSEGPHRRCLLILLLTFFTAPFPTYCIEFGSITRFHKLLKAYDHPVYRASDRDIYIDADYSALGFGASPRAESLDDNLGGYSDSFEVDFEGAAGVRLLHLRSSPLYQYSDSIDISVNGFIRRNTETRGNATTGIFDTAATGFDRATAGILYQGAVRRYLTSGWLRKKPVFIEAGGIFHASGDYGRNWQTVHFNSGGYDFSHRVKELNEEVRSYIVLSPSIGYGKQLPVAPQYKAFEVERKLRKSGAVASTLSDSTLLRLASLFGSLPSFRLAHDRPDKYYMDELERVLLADASIDSSRLNGYSLFDAYETFTEYFPLIKRGFEIKVAAVDVRAAFYHQRWTMDSTAIRGEFNFDLDYAFPFSLSYTLPVVSRFFLEAGAQSNYRFYDDPLRYSGSIGACFLITNRIMSRLSFSDIPLLLIVPKGIPEDYELETSIYMEDHLMLQLTCFSRGYRNYWANDKNRLADYWRRAGASLRLLYDF